METITLVLSPVVVWGITALIKRIPAVDSLSASKASLLRLVVTVLSFGAVAGGAIVNGGAVDVTSVQAVVEAFYIFFASTGIHHVMN